MTSPIAAVKPLVPRFILDQLAAGNLAGGYPAVGCFVDVAGFSKLTDKLMTHGQHGAEVLAAVMRRVFDCIVFPVYEQGGFVATFAGDAFTALFPLPAGAEAQMAWRALSAALTIQANMAAEPAHATPYGDFAIAAKVGLAAGAMSWGIFQSPDRQQAMFYVRGPAVTGCAHAEQEAASGDIIVDERLAALAGQRLVLAPAGDYFRVQGHQGSLHSADPVVLPPVDPELSRRFFPTAALEQLDTGEFRQVVNVFIRLAGTPADDDLDTFMQALFAIQRRYGGLLNRIDFADKGTHLLLFWGAPVAYENDVARALNALLDLRARSPIAFNAGVTTAIAHAGAVGSEIRMEYTCSGRGVNLAARLMTTAPETEIWLDEAIAQRARQQFSLTALGEHPFKGFAQPQPVYRLERPRERAQISYQGRLFGREEELARLQAFAAPLASGQFAGSLLVAGPAGIGKSRLVHQFLTDLAAAEQPVQVFRTQTDEIVRRSLNPLRHWLRDYFNQSTQADEATNKGAFVQRLEQLLADTSDEGLRRDLQRTRSLLSALVDLYWADSLYNRLTPEQRFANTLQALTALLQAESRRRPVLLLIEDVHWLDDDTQAFVASLEQHGRQAAPGALPLGILLTARPEESDVTVPADRPVLAVTPLANQAVAAMAAEIIGGPVSQEMVDAICRRADGNPFFVEQILRYLKENQLLTWSDGVCSFTLTATDLLPVDVRTLVVARLDRLGQAVRNVVQNAAILGREFNLEILRVMLAEPARLAEHVDRAARAGVWQYLDENQVVFQHALLRDAAYHMQIHRRRQRLHGRAAAVYQELFAADLAPHYGTIAYHAETAGLEDDARRFLTLAGHQARDGYENQSAFDFYSRALNLTAPDAARQRFDLLAEREQILRQIGDITRQEADLAAMRAFAAAIEDRAALATLALHEGHLANRTSRPDEAVTVLQQGLTLAEEIDDKRLRAEILREWAYALHRQGNLQAEAEKLNAALTVARQTADREIEMLCFQDLSKLAQFRGRLAQARAHAEAGLRIAHGLGHRWGEADLLLDLGIIARKLGEEDKATHFVEASVALNQEVGRMRASAQGLVTLGNIDRASGRAAKAKTHYQEALATFNRLGDLEQAGHCRYSLGELALVTGDHANAERYLTEALASHSNGSQIGEALCLFCLGVLARDRGEVDTARQTLAIGLRKMEQAGFQPFIGALKNEIGAALLETGRLAAAIDMARAAKTHNLSLGADGYALESTVLLARAHLAIGDAAAAQKELASALPRLLAAPDLSQTERPGQVYWWCFEILTAAGDSAAASILATGIDHLTSKAQRLGSDELATMFWNNIPAHRALHRAYFVTQKRV